ncbi:MAG: hypothetical protein F6J97_24860 [Leptolyngbya sp. SIO4C1]|nr:hypothetical protein [Leptolyngbya sp. SIO4C1]
MDYKVSNSFKRLDINRVTVSEDHITDAIISVIQSARSQGQSLDDVMAELLADDALLDNNIRHLLGDIVAQAWETLR